MEPHTVPNPTSHQPLADDILRGADEIENSYSATGEAAGRCTILPHAHGYLYSGLALCSARDVPFF